MSPVSLAVALILVASAATAAQTSTQRTQKQRRAGQAPFGQELEGQSRASLAQQNAARQPPASAATPETAVTTVPPRPVVTDGETITLQVARDAHLVGFPFNAPLNPGPASPIR
jgi:hypothetical protein